MSAPSWMTPTCWSLRLAWYERKELVVRLAFTGHRPPKAGLTHSTFGEGDRAAVIAVVDLLAELEPEFVIVGGALGFDTLAARAAAVSGVPYRVYVPFKGQQYRWPLEAKDRYGKMLELAEAVEIVDPRPETGYAPWKMHYRNQRMVNDADRVVAWWDGSPGGTANCVKYALSKGKDVDNLWIPELIGAG